VKREVRSGGGDVRGPITAGADETAQKMPDSEFPASSSEADGVDKQNNNEQKLQYAAIS
jgi:hypothetical protein